MADWDTDAQRRRSVSDGSHESELATQVATAMVVAGWGEEQWPGLSCCGSTECCYQPSTGAVIATEELLSALGLSDLTMVEVRSCVR